MHVKKLYKRILSCVCAASMLLSTLPVSAAGIEETVSLTSAAESTDAEIIEALRSTASGEYVSTIETPQDSDIINPDYDRSYDNYVVESDSGLLHPGILMSREELNIMRDMVWIGAEPWASAFEALQESPYASLDYEMDGPYEIIESDRENYALDRTATAAYELTLMWYITGNQAYADKVKDMLLSWAETTTYDSSYDHIRMGIALQKLCFAAEVLCYTPSSGWTDEDTETFNQFLDVSYYALDKSYEYYNQGLYALSGFMYSAIFRDDYEEYAVAVERLAYNEAGGWKNGYSVNYSLSAMIFNNGEIVEMGRDQGHSNGDVRLLSALVRTTYIQGTEVDETGNIVKTGGVDLYEFENQKLLKAETYYAIYNLGEDVEYVACQNAWGDATEWEVISATSRGETILWDPSTYYHYRYIKGYEDTDERTILEPTETDPTEDSFLTYGDCYYYLTADMYSQTEYEVDFPDFGDLTFTPLAAIQGDTLSGAPGAYAGDGDNCTSYNRYLANLFTGSGNGSSEMDEYVQGQNGGVITEPSTDEEGYTHFITSDVNNGEWIAYSIDFEEDFGITEDNLATVLQYVQGNNSSAGGDIKVKIGDYNENPSQEDYESSTQIMDIHIDYTGGYYIFAKSSYEIPEEYQSLLTGKKNVYFYYYGSSNVYNFNCDTLWFKFATSSAFDPFDGADADVSANAQISEDSAVLSDGGYIGFGNMDFDSGFTAFTAQISTQGGVLKIYQDAPNETDGVLVASYELEQTEAMITFDFEQASSIQGNHDLYLVYEGDDTLSLGAMLFTAVSTSSDTYMKNEAGDYQWLSQGSAEITENNGLLMDASGEGTYVAYTNIPFLNGPSMLAVRVKSSGSCTLYFDLLNGAVSSSGLTGVATGKGGSMATFVLEDTSEMSEDGWITCYFDVTTTGANEKLGNNFVGMWAAGGEEGTIVEVEYFLFDPENQEPVLTLTEENSEQDLGTEITVAYSEGSRNYILTAEDADGDQVSVSVYGTPDEGISYSEGILTLDTSKSGTEQIRFLVSDGEVTKIAEYTFTIQSEEDSVNSLIEASGIEDSLLSFYVYDNDRYTQYINAKTAALEEPGNAEYVETLEEVIEDCLVNIPAYTKIKFEYRETKNTSATDPTFTVYLDTSETHNTNHNNKKDVPSTGRIVAQSDALAATSAYSNSGTAPASESDWYEFSEPISGSHTLAIAFSTSSARLISFTLSNEDETMTKTIAAVSCTAVGCTVHMKIWNGVTNYGGSVDYEVRGDNTWVQYTLDDGEYDLSTFTFSNNTTWPYAKSTAGTGINFTLMPAIVTAVADAEEYLENETLYTSNSIAALREVYETAKDYVDNYAERNLTRELSDEQAAAVNAAIENLVVNENLVTIEADTENTAVTVDMSGNNDGDLTGSNLSMNPTFTANAGEEISFYIDASALEDALEEASVCYVEEIGVRGTYYTGADSLTEIDPVMEDTGITVEETEESGVYKVTWSYYRPGNYRATFHVACGEDTFSKTVEMIFRNSVDRPDLVADYVRVRFSCFRTDTTKQIDFYLVPVNDDGSEDTANKVLIASLDYDDGLYRTGGEYLLSDWVEVTWPEEMPDNYILQMESTGRNIQADFIEFATASYTELYDNTVYQAYPLSASGVMRIEAEHLDYNSLNAYSNIDYSGKYAFEIGTPGEGEASANIGGSSETSVVTLKYNDVVFGTSVSEDYVETEELSVQFTEIMAKDDTQQITVALTPENASGEVSYATSDPSVATVSSDGVITATGFGEVTITALNAEQSDSMTLRVADRDYLEQLVVLYQTYILGNESDYTQASEAELKAAYSQAYSVLYGTEAEFPAEETDTALAAVMESVLSWTGVTEDELDAENAEAAADGTLEEIPQDEDAEGGETDGSEAESDEAAGEESQDGTSADDAEESSGDTSGAEVPGDEESDSDAAEDEDVASGNGSSEDEESESEVPEDSSAGSSDGETNGTTVSVIRSSNLSAAFLTTGTSTAQRVQAATLQSSSGKAAALSSTVTVNDSDADSADTEGTDVQADAAEGEAFEADALEGETTGNEADESAVTEGVAVESTVAAESTFTESAAVVESASDSSSDETDVSELEAIYNATVDLLNALNNRVKAANMTAYNTYLSIAQSLDESDYTAESWAVLEEAVESTASVTKEDTQETVNAAATTLQLAIFQLEGETFADEDTLAELKALAEEAEQIVNENYTDDSWEILQDALADANDVLNADRPTLVQAQAAYIALAAAMAGLEENPVDTTALEALYAENSSRDESAYTQESWEAFYSALTNAQSVLESETATQSEVDDAYNSLAATVEGLVAAADETDKTALQEKADEAKAIDGSGYTEDSYQALQNAIAQAETVLADEDASKAEVENALQLLEDAIAYLTPVKETKTADKTDLQALYDELSTLEQGDYTADTWNTLVSRLASALAVLDDPEASQEEVDKAEALLKAAKEALTTNSSDEGDNTGASSDQQSADTTEAGEDPWETVLDEISSGKTEITMPEGYDSIPNRVMKALDSDKTYTLTFSDGTVVTIPADEAADDDTEWYGPEWLKEHYGTASSAESSTASTDSGNGDVAATDGAQTGDSMGAMLMVSMLIAAVAGLSVFVVYRRRKLG